tara:strand:- start:256 stop:426 length:171 start_codon:yes stop_codon:yes gene_type:complete
MKISPSTRVLIIDDETGKLLKSYFIKEDEVEDEVIKLKETYHDVSEDCDGDIIVWA